MVTLKKDGWKRTGWGGWTASLSGKRLTIRKYRTGGGGLSYVPRIEGSGLASPAPAFSTLKLAQEAAITAVLSQKEVTHENQNRVRINRHLKGEPLTKATIKDGIYEIGKVRFGVDETSVRATVEAVKRQPRPTHEQIIWAHGGETDSTKPDEEVQILASSYVQNDWYEILKGAIPMATKKNHEKRIAKHAKATKKERKVSGAAAAPRAMKTFKLTGDKAKLAKLAEIKSPQQQLILKVLRSANGKAWTTRELAEAVEKTKKLETKQGATKVVAFYATQYRKNGFLVEA